ncbi:MAG: SsrA-binding protein SmpB [Planctomycetota bacterium]
MAADRRSNGRGGDDSRRRSIARNRRATHEYEVLDELETGIVLAGTEVKSLRAGRVSLQEAYCVIKRGELFILRMHIPEYAQGNVHNHEPTRDRKLLAKKREILKWEKAVREKGTTLVPLEILWDGSLVKVRVGLVRGKKLHDKRQAKREKDDKREIDRALKAGRRDV